MKILLLFSAISLTLVGHILRIERFTLILNEKSISKRDSYESLAIGYIFNSFLPIRLGEIARAVRLSGSNIKKILICRLSDSYRKNPRWNVSN